jgi:hypothetical protein
MVESFPSIQYGVEAEVREDVLPGLVAHVDSFFGRKLHHADHRRAQASGVAGRSEESRAAMHDDLAAARDIGGYRGQGAGSGFEQAHGEAFPS